MSDRQETQVVLKYCEVIDEFIKVRVFAEDDVSGLLNPKDVNNRRAYQRSVVESTVLDYQETVLPLFKKFNRIYKPEALEDVLYQICVEVNPQLEIHQVCLPCENSEDAEKSPDEHPLAMLASKACGLERDLMTRVIGQGDAVRKITKSIKKAAVGLKDPRKPIGVYLLVGSTGSGKTELAKVVTERLLDSPGNLIRVDCSEFALPHEYAKLIGAPPGYIGHNEGGFLTEAVKDKKTCVILFDEIEKAHHKVHNLLLQLMDEGTLTDGKGSVVKFDSALVLLTSNLGISEIENVRNRCGFDTSRRSSLSKVDQQDAIDMAMKEAFSPEFLNRLDDIIVFNTLTEKDCHRIARLQLSEVASYLRGRGINLRFTRSVEAYVAKQGFSEEYGARELRRIIRNEIENPLAEMILDGTFSSGDTITITIRAGELQFQGEQNPKAGKKPQSKDLPEVANHPGN